MSITKRARIILGTVAIAGAALAVGAASTAGGMAFHEDASGFVGGTNSIGITGGTISGIAYTVTDNEIDAVELTFTGVPEGHAVSIQFTGALDAVQGSYSCDVVDALISSTCTAGGGETDKAVNTAATNLSITVLEPA